MTTQPQQQHLTSTALNSNPNHLSKIQQTDSHQNNAKYFLNMFYNPSKQYIDSAQKYVQISKYTQRYPQKQNRQNNYDNSMNRYSNVYRNSGNGYLTYCGYLLAIVSTLLFVFFIIDLNTEYYRQKVLQQTNNRQCFKSYEQNQCNNPVDILIDKCKQWRQCYHEQPHVRYTVVFIKVINHMIKTFVSGLGYICVGIVIIVIAICVWRPRHAYHSNHNDCKPYQKNNKPVKSY